MPPMARGAFAPLLAPDLRKVYVEIGKERPPEYNQWCNIDPNMQWNPVRDQQVSGLGTMPSKLEGTTFALDQPILGGNKSYIANPYGLAVEITWEMWRDDLYGVMREIIAGLARASRNRLEVSGHAVLNNAFNTAFTGFTAGEALCSTAHVGMDGSTRANRPSPDISFSNTGIQAAVNRFEAMTDERGLPRLMAPVMALITPTNKYLARELLGSSGKPFTADNEINALIEEDLSWMVDHYLSVNTRWFLLAAKGVHDLNMMVRDQPIFDSFDDPWSKNAIFTTYQRHTDSQFGSWRGVDGSTG